MLFIPGLEAGDLSDKAAVDAALAGAIYWPAGTTTLCGIEVPGLLFALSASTALNPYPLALFGESQSGALWRCTVPSSLRAATDGTGEAAVGAAIARINDTSGNALHLTQASTSLRPIRGRRPKTGPRNILVPWNSFQVWGETAPSFVSGVNARAVTANAAANPVDGAMNATKIAASDTHNQQRIYTTSMGAQTGSRRTLSCYLKAAGINHVNLRTTGIEGVNFNLATGVATNLAAANAASWGMEDLGDGWYRCYVVLVTSALEVAWLQLVNGANTSAFSGNGTDGVYAYGYQVENSDHVTPLQQVNGSLLNITEAGVESVSYAAFDLVDDTLATGGIAGGLTGQAFVAGDGGCYVNDLSIAAGVAFSIGGTSHRWAGTPPGILRAVTGDTGRVLDVMLREGSFTEDEIARLERYYRALGGKGLLVPDGDERVINGTFSTDISGVTNPAPTRSTLSWDAGELKMDAAAGSGDYPPATILLSAMTAGVPYLIQWDARTTDGALTTGIIFGPYSNAAGFAVAPGQKAVVVPSTAIIGFSLYGSPLKTVWFDNVSVQRLIPREDL